MYHYLIQQEVFSSTGRVGARVRMALSASTAAGVLDARVVVIRGLHCSLDFLIKKVKKLCWSAWKMQYRRTSIWIKLTFSRTDSQWRLKIMNSKDLLTALDRCRWMGSYTQASEDFPLDP
jgi:hypothetical protein